MSRTLLEVLEASTVWLRQHGIDGARLDAELLSCSVLGLQRLDLYLNFDRPLDDAELRTLREAVQRRGTGESVAYIVGYKDFHDVRIPVGPGVLVPRPETEALVELGLKALGEREEALWLDLCTGSGCVAVAAAHAHPGLKVIATDLSAEALEWARKAVEAHELGARVALRRGDLFGAIPERFQGGFHVITANPPYIGQDDPAIHPHVREHEPAMALFAEEGGLAVIRSILEQASAWLEPGGVILLEMGHEQGPASAAIARAAGWEGVEVVPDLAGHDRVLRAIRSA